MIRTLKALSLLLSYPTEELKAGAADLRAAVAEEGLVSARVRTALEPLFLEFETDELIDLQGRYVDLFDRTRSLALHLFEHVHGESRERGQAMIDLRETYLRQGYEMTPQELPDYLPAFLEFAAMLPVREARQTLADPVHVLQALHERLVDRGSPYAAVLAAAVEFAGARPAADALQQMRGRPDPHADDFAAVDAAWEEAPVRFGPETAEPTGFVAKMRAWRRPADRAGQGSNR